MNELTDTQERAPRTEGATAHRSSISPVVRLRAVGALVVWTLLAGAAPASPTPDSWRRALPPAMACRRHRVRWHCASASRCTES